jgi:autotransporter-associated beta strand protein
LIPEGPQLFNRSDAITYSGIISGSGEVTKQGGGTLTLAGANSYSNLTTIAGGTMALSGLGSIGTGGFFDIAALASGTYSLPSTGPSVPMIGETPAFPLLE